MSDQFLDSIKQLKPENWRDMANSAKFLKGFYAAFVDAALEIVSSKGSTPSQVLSSFQQINYFSRLERDANRAYLGAKSASIENKQGNFRVSLWDP